LFADIRSGTVTTPLIMLREAATPEEKQKLKECFNNPYLTTEQIYWLQEFIITKLPRKRIYALVLENYRQFLETMNKTVVPEYITLCQKWVDYKINQANALLLSNR
jgi:hypothetical protein